MKKKALSLVLALVLAMPRAFPALLHKCKEKSTPGIFTFPPEGVIVAASMQKGTQAASPSSSRKVDEARRRPDVSLSPRS